MLEFCSELVDTYIMNNEVPTTDRDLDIMIADHFSSSDEPLELVMSFKDGKCVLNKKPKLVLLQGGKADYFGEFPESFYDHLGDGDLDFIESYGPCDFALAYGEAIIANTLVAWDEDMIAIQTDSGYEVSYFHKDGSLKHVYRNQ